MVPTITVSEELQEQINRHLGEGESQEEFIAELLHYYESQATPLWEGYGGPP